ncbi:hypothetical protein L873DRAFT_886483 [Choiromyces venosus 120613-1]|uniref:Uncharacterized protein n=1 Tax=Choiromyces venosus 120613-1 TaxID=1336337 RepID=A0A3N4IWU8_9PEZI|nr:hypothetical protein L873DRAFT_886483 [Choiromyces venosus 120613-1]
MRLCVEPDRFFRFWSSRIARYDCTIHLLVQHIRPLLSPVVLCTLQWFHIVLVVPSCLLYSIIISNSDQQPPVISSSLQPSICFPLQVLPGPRMVEPRMVENTRLKRLELFLVIGDCRYGLSYFIFSTV